MFKKIIDGTITILFLTMLTSMVSIIVAAFITTYKWWCAVYFPVGVIMLTIALLLSDIAASVVRYHAQNKSFKGALRTWLDKL